MAGGAALHRPGSAEVSNPSDGNSENTQVQVTVRGWHAGGSPARSVNVETPIAAAIMRSRLCPRPPAPGTQVVKSLVLVTRRGSDPLRSWPPGGPSTGLGGGGKPFEVGLSTWPTAHVQTPPLSAFTRRIETEAFPYPNRHSRRDTKEKNRLRLSLGSQA